MYLGIAGLSSVVLLDAWWISQLSEAALTAVGFAGPVLIAGLNVLLAFGTGVAAVLAPRLGRHPAAPLRAFWGIALTLGVLLGLGLWAGQEALLTAMGMPPAQQALIRPYLSAFAIGLPLMALLSATMSALRAAGRMRAAALSLVLLCLANALLDPLLIFTLDWGLAGAAWATTIAASLGLLWSCWPLRKLAGAWRSKPAWWRDLLPLGRIVLPAAGLRLLLPLGASLVIRWITALEPDFIAAYGVGQRVDLWVMMFPIALSTVASPQLGLAWGQGQPARGWQWLRQAGLLAAGYGLLALLGLLAVVWLVPAATETWWADLLRYLSWMVWAYPAQGLFQLGQNAWYTLHRPGHAVGLALLQWGLWMLLAWLALAGASEYRLGGVLLAWPLSLWLAAGLVWYGLRRSIMTSDPPED